MAGSTKTSLTNDLKREGPSRKGGQKETDGHSGIIKVPRPEQAVRTRTASTTGPTGGQTQLFSPLQSCTKASTPLQPGEANLELKRGS